MIKPKDPRELAEAILTRSTCSVKVGAVVEDKNGIFGWGWNSVGPSGYGLHAEHHCILRSNKARLAGATLYVATMRARNDKVINSKPCHDCQTLIKWAKLRKVLYRDSDGIWRKL